MVGHGPLKPVILVRFQVPQHYWIFSTRLFEIPIALLNKKLFYLVDMTRPEQRESEQISYIINEKQKYRKKTTNFFFENQEPFVLTTIRKR